MVGAAGAGASAAALLASWAGAAVDGCDPGGPSPYTPALDAAGISVAPRHDPAHVSGDGRPARLAVTKALTAVDPDHPELAAAREAGIPIEPWQQVVADAAAGRRLVGDRRHARQEHVGGLAGPRPRVGRPGSRGVRRGPAAGGPDRVRRAGHGAPGRGRRVRRRGRRVRGQLRRLPPGRHRADVRRMGPPRRVRGPGGGAGRVRGVDPARGCGGRRHRAAPVLVANVGDAGVAELVARLGDWPGRIVATALVDAAPQRIGGFARGIADRFGSASGPPRRSSAGSPRPTPRRRPSRSRASTRSPARSRVRLPTAGRHNAANALGVAGARAPPLGVDAGVDRGAASPRSRASGGGSSARARPAGVVVYDDYGHHPTAIRETLRRRPPARAGAPRLGGLRAADLPPDGGAARRVRRGARGGRRRGDRRHLGGPRSRHVDQLGRRPGRGRRGPEPRASPSRRPGASRRRRPGSPARSGRRRRPGDGRRPHYRIGELLLAHLEAR